MHDHLQVYHQSGSLYNQDEADKSVKKILCGPFRWYGLIFWVGATLDFGIL